MLLRPAAARIRGLSQREPTRVCRIVCLQSMSVHVVVCSSCVRVLAADRHGVRCRFTHEIRVGELGHYGTTLGLTQCRTRPLHPVPSLH